MNNNSSRDIILNKIKKSQKDGRKYYVPSFCADNIDFPHSENLLDTFTNELTAIGGKVILTDSEDSIPNEILNICNNKNINDIFCFDNDIINLINKQNIDISINKGDFKNMEIGITKCEYLVARTGSILVSSNQNSGRKMNIFPPTHIVVANKSQLIDLPENALEKLNNKYINNFPSFISFITGASRTADIEKTLIMGAHGPKELIVIVNTKK